ncbi:hypothetical protein GOP47_0023175 [Adiantum capillus-veneris]|uniref:Uncharacterized protein n=1 Tax=Adiantum capillus-veneris TaxID=13818 RepID=A0A9D4Z7L4_ADICA|nr:hypothetical protein GOP47_0023175 [Adiantum capillus-veneris]
MTTSRREYAPPRGPQPVLQLLHISARRHPSAVLPQAPLDPAFPDSQARPWPGSVLFSQPTAPVLWLCPVAAISCYWPPFSGSFPFNCMAPPLSSSPWPLPWILASTRRPFVAPIPTPAPPPPSYGYPVDS